MAAQANVETATRPSARTRLLAVQELMRGLVTGSDARIRDQRNAGYAFLVRVASAGLLYLTQIALARWMGSSDYGIYVYLWTWVLVLSGLSNLGLPVVMLRMMPEYLVQKDHGRLKGLLRFGQYASLVSGATVAGIGLFVLWLAHGHLAPPYVVPAVFALLCVPLVGWSEMLDGIGRSRGWMLISLIPPYVLRPALLLVLMAAAYLTGAHLGAPNAMLAALAAALLAVLVQAVAINRAFRTETASAEVLREGATWLLSGLPLLAVMLSDLVLQNADVLILSAFLPPAEIGMYFAAAKTMSLVSFVHYAVGSAMANRLSQARAQGDAEGLARLAGDAVGWTFWPSLAGGLVILTLGKFLLAMFNPSFVAAYPVMLVLAAGLFVRASVGPSDTVLNMLGAGRITAVILVAAAMLNVALALVLVPRLGMIGAAMATSTAYALAATANAVAARRLLGLRLFIVDVLWARRARP